MSLTIWGCLISLVTAVIEPVEMTIYTISGGFENLNHRKLFFLDSPFSFLSIY